MFNVALGWAFLISAIASPGGKIVALVLIPDAMSALPPYQKVLLSVFANYWVPAICIYLLLKAFRIDRYLKPSVGVHCIFGVSNLLLSTYAGLRIFTATVEGGGATFALASIGTLIAIPCWLALIVGSIWLFIRSLILFGSTDESDSVREVASRSMVPVVIAGIMLLPPIVFFAHLYSNSEAEIRSAKKKLSIQKDRFAVLCGYEGIKLNKVAADAKSLYFRRHSSLIFYLLDNLEYIETLSSDARNKAEGEPKYRRLTRKEGKEVRVELHAAVDAIPVHDISAQYEISFKAPTTKADSDMGFYVNETWIVDRQSDEALAIITKVGKKQTVSRSSSNRCPGEFYRHYSPLIAYVLGLTDESETNAYAKVVQNYPGRNITYSMEHSIE